MATSSVEHTLSHRSPSPPPKRRPSESGHQWELPKARAADWEVAFYALLVLDHNDDLRAGLAQRRNQSFVDMLKERVDNFPAAVRGSCTSLRYGSKGSCTYEGGGHDRPRLSTIFTVMTWQRTHVDSYDGVIRREGDTTVRVSLSSS